MSKLIPNMADGLQAIPVDNFSQHEGCYRLVRGFELELFFQERNLSYTLSPEELQALKSLCLSALNDTKDKTISRQKTKLFSNCKENRLHPLTDQWVLNLSSH